MPFKDPVKRKLKQREYQQTYYQRHQQKHYAATRVQREKVKQWFRDFKKDLQCSYCPENHPACLDFHHIDPTIKAEPVSQMATQGYGKKKILNEIDKCIVLCSNCHRKLHYDADRPK